MIMKSAFRAINCYYGCYRMRVQWLWEKTFVIYSKLLKSFRAVTRNKDLLLMKSINRYRSLLKI